MFLESSPVTAWCREIKRPTVHPTAYIHHSAVLIGDVRIEKNVIICPGVVIRADEGSPVVIGEGSNIQDRVVMHCLKGSSIEVGESCSIAHGAIIHGPCVLGRKTFIGFNSVILDARLGEGCFVSHMAMVSGVDLPESTLVPAGRVIQAPADTRGLPRTGEGDIQFNNKVLSVNQELCSGYRYMRQLETPPQQHPARPGYHRREPAGDKEISV